jgi:hypothetical protein
LESFFVAGHAVVSNRRLGPDLPLREITEIEGTNLDRTLRVKSVRASLAFFTVGVPPATDIN